MTALPIPFLLFLFFVGGLALGSFGNVLIFRLPEGRSARGRSACPACKRVLNAGELVPVLSFLVLRGRCRTCRAPISWQYPLVELGSGVLAVTALHLEGFFLPAAGFLAVIFWLMLLIAVIDAQTGFIPDALCLPLLFLTMLYAFLWPPLGFDGPIIAGGFFLLQWLVSRGRWVGSGDILLAVGLGFLLRRLDLTILMLMLGYILGAVVASVMLMRKKKTLQSAVPFGPFLIVSTFVVLLWGEQILAMFFR